MTPLESALRRCEEWARQLRKELGCQQSYAFGSTVLRDGSQFDPQSSDIDLAVVIPDRTGLAPGRSEWVKQLKKPKHDLEISLIPILGRAKADRPIVSVVVVTTFELQHNIHKDGARTFWNSSTFRNLLEASSSLVPLLAGHALRLSETKRQVSQWAQKTRHTFLHVSAAGSEVLTEWDDPHDPLPKAMMRMAALAGGGTDVQIGLDNISAYLQSRAARHEAYRDAHNWLSIRRAARGKPAPLSPYLHLLLAEAILDLALHRTPVRGIGAIAQSSTTAERRIPRLRPRGVVRINSYKLFYHRVTQKLSVRDLALATGLERRLIQSLERVDPKLDLLTGARFPQCKRRVLRVLEEQLGCPGTLAFGTVDDFLTQYLIFYEAYKGKNPKTRRNTSQLDLRFRTHAVVFDFDGTLALHPGNYTTWEQLWIMLGYQTEQCFDLHARFQHGEFTHQHWCDLTAKAFKAGGLKRRHLAKVASSLSLVPGTAETIAALRRRNVSLYILSGSIKSVIKSVLGPLYSEFEAVKANDIHFSARSGTIEHIRGTPYDFKGKATYINQIVQEAGISPLSVLFVGNSCNDIFASRSGARTLCVNPRFTDPENIEHWTYEIRSLTNLNQVMQYVTL